jgi:hypothetical protein
MANTNTVSKNDLLTLRALTAEEGYTRANLSHLELHALTQSPLWPAIQQERAVLAVRSAALATFQSTLRETYELGEGDAIDQETGAVLQRS